METEIRWGIIGWGKIAKKFAADLSFVEGAKLKAVASYSLAKENVLPAELIDKTIYHDYESLVRANDIDVIYVATPHGLHFDHVMLCLENGKPVLCEKAFALNKSQAEKMIETASAKNLFLMEAMWTKFLPHFKVLQKLISNGKIGTIQYVSTQFGFVPAEPIADRIFDPNLGGGSLLDIGVYNVFLTLNLLGIPDTVNSLITRAGTGVDLQCASTFQYQGGAIAQLFSSFASNIATEANICGSKGRLKLSHRFYAPQTNIHYFSGGMESKEEIPFERSPGWGYHYEAAHVQDCIREGRIESPVMSWSDTLMQMEILDLIRQQAGYEFV